jgi:serine/threonine protein kinase
MNWLREPEAEPIPGYRLIAPLGAGGFGEVWKCVAPGGILKAIKFVYGNLDAVDGDNSRAEQEHKAMMRIKDVRHPFVLSMDRIEIIGGELAIVMELADKSLHDVLVEYNAGGQVGIPRVDLLRYMRDAADGLDYLNEKHGLQHLDVKPRNLFVIADRVKVADFGLVKNLDRSSNSGLKAGVTPIYAPPESFSGKISRHSDQYSLAIVYQELLTGQRPFNGKNIRQMALQHLSEPPDLSSLPEQDRAIVARALAKNPDDRYPNCMAFVQALCDASMADDRMAATAREMPRPYLVPATPASPRPTPVPVPFAPSAQPKLEDSAPLVNTVSSADVGILRPTLFIGLGSYGRRAILELRCRLLDRFGDLSLVPIFRFLYVDSDPEAVHKATNEAPEVALSSGELFPMPLQPVTNYRRRTLEHISEWLPREKLYAMPRSLQPLGSRALGRLAFCDNYLRLMTRLRREIQVATHPETLAQSVSQTGLPLRDNNLRAYVVSSALGGSGGVLVDLAYAIMRQAENLRHPVAPPVLFLFCGAPGDPATPKNEQANLYATLTELNHYSDPSVSFTAQYGPDAAPVVSTGPPFSNTYLLALEHREPQGQRESVGRLAGYLRDEVTTALGNEVANTRTTSNNGASFRSIGVRGLWFPRGLMLRMAARAACERIVHTWQEPDPNLSPALVTEACARALADPGLKWDALANLLSQEARTEEGMPTEIVARMLGDFEQDASRGEARINLAIWAQRVVEQLEPLVGLTQTVQDEGAKRSRFQLLLYQAAERAAHSWDKKLMKTVDQLMERPGRRLAAAEAALRQMLLFCENAEAAQSQVVEEQHRIAWEQIERLQFAKASCNGSGLSRFFSGGPQRQAKAFLDSVAAAAQARLMEDSLTAGRVFFSKLKARLREHLQDLDFFRLRLNHLLKGLSEAQTGDAIDDSNSSSLRLKQAARRGHGEMYSHLAESDGTVEVVFPSGADNLERAAYQFLGRIKDDDFIQLDKTLQDLVLSPLGGLHTVCQRSSDLGRTLAIPMVDQAAAFLAKLLPLTDLTATDANGKTGFGRDLAKLLDACFAGATPYPTGRGGAHTAFLILSDSASGRRFGAEALSTMPELRLVHLSNHGDLMVIRERGPLTISDLRPLLYPCRHAYRDQAGAPQSSPHSRFDQYEWLPLEP